MLAAGNSKQNFAVPANGLDYGGISGRITGVQCYHHINGAAGGIALNIPSEKG